MAKQLTYKVLDSNDVIARFDSHDDAMKFAEVITLDGSREVTVEDRAGWVTYHFTNGYINNIK